MAGEVRARDESGLLVPTDDPELVVEIRRADGLDGRRLRAEQAQVIREVLAWLARRRSENGRRAA
jgi:hypothetical protein